MGNVLVLTAMLTTPSLRSPSTIFLCSLAVSDLLVGFVVQPIYIGFRINPGPELEHFAYILVSLGCSVSLCTMTAISVDRFMALHFHVRYPDMMTNKRAVNISLSLWFLACTTSCIILWNVTYPKLVMDCWSSTEPGAMEKKCYKHLYILHLYDSVLFSDVYITATTIECFHSRRQHLCKFIGTKESVCIRKEFNSHRTGLGHQHGRRFIVLGHQDGRRDVMWKHSIVTRAMLWLNHRVKKSTLLLTMKLLQKYEYSSHDVTSAMLVSQTSPVGVELFSNVNTFKCWPREWKRSIEFSALSLR